MPTMPYFNAAGVRVPGTTTVIGTNLGWSKDGLMYYAWEKGKAGKDFRDYTKNAAEIGTLAHSMIEEYIHGRAFKAPADALPEHIEKAKVAWKPFLTWLRNSKIQVVATEVAFVSEKWQFGGCIDAILLTEDEKGNPELAIGDWKTSNGTYADHLIQLRAYKEGFEEVTGLALTGGYHLFRFSKEAGNFVHHYWPADSLEKAWKAFTHLRNLHELKKPLNDLSK